MDKKCGLCSEMDRLEKLVEHYIHKMLWYRRAALNLAGGDIKKLQEAMNKTE